MRKQFSFAAPGLFWANLALLVRLSERNRDAVEMRSYRRVARVIANEGFVGVAKRILPVSKSRPSFSPRPKSQIKEEFDQLASEFFARTEKMGRGELKDYYWYHTIDLGNGLVTPGTYDY